MKNVSKEMSESIRFTVNPGGPHGISGFTLIGVGETYAEAYCLSFPTAQAKRKGSVTFEDGNIVFTHGGVSPQEANPTFSIYGMSEGGIFSTGIHPEAAEELSQLLAGKGKYAGAQVRVRMELAFGKGFTLYVKQD